MPSHYNNPSKAKTVKSRKSKSTSKSKRQKLISK